MYDDQMQDAMAGMGKSYQSIGLEMKRATDNRKHPSEVRPTLLAVSKTKPVSMILELMSLGQQQFGENRVQELQEKYRYFDERGLPQPKWHLIGHLQRNKVKYIAPYIEMIHSVDSIELAREISRQAMLYNRRIPVLVEVNVAGEDSKFGIHPSESENFIRSLASLPGLLVKGLMTVAPFVENPEENRLVFQKLYEIFIDIQEKNIDNICMCELSMGMSNDFSVAIEEGATIVRIGSSLFGSR